MFQIRRLTESVGGFRTGLLLFATILLWLIAVWRLIEARAADVLMWMSAGLAVSVVSFPAIRRYRRVYDVLISFFWLGIMGGAIALKQLPRVQRDEYVWCLIVAGSFYCHSAILTYGNLDMPKWPFEEDSDQSPEI
jgi:hypothetical protein